ncbi:hypothetical protein GUJ93_ZPchr0004g38213 [Zizania palustris]|uniref:Uncharacterized protein n=1 Tax=Zizania palustris TaxID=103762 RepID=A0A8J5SH79_ZIZPA|nr:hypothetical protein GUJ93_ZPchr0004g38213 [Zizania palustris]
MLACAIASPRHHPIYHASDPRMLCLGAANCARCLGTMPYSLGNVPHSLDNRTLPYLVCALWTCTLSPWRPTCA